MADGGAVPMIKLGLQRVRLLLQGTPLPWRAVHVAGTNGKGSVCANLSAMLRQANIRTGRFTSPHLIDRWDCICIDDKPIAESVFRQAEASIKTQNETRSIEATPFELLTATAFEIFNQQAVQVAVVECGMGGRLDATNILQDPLVTVITSIGLDHQAFLGDTLPAIAGEKAGIMKPRASCIAESSNDSAVLDTLTRAAQRLGVDLHVVPVPEWFAHAMAVEQAKHGLPSLPMLSASSDSFASIQLRNQWLAYQALTLALPAMGMHEASTEPLLAALAHAKLRGRFEQINLKSLSGRANDVLLDGAHNDQAMKLVCEYRDQALHVRSTNAGSRHSQSTPCTWLIACSSTKGDIFRIPESDHVIITEFGPVDGMPWVQPMAAKDVLAGRPAAVTERKPHVLEALRRACKVANEGPMIITGSLYLASDVLRLLRDADAKQKAPFEII